MLYTQCASCHAIGPLACAGMMFPHMPLPLVPSPMGPACPGCGGVMRTFTCTTCFTGQVLIMPGSAPPRGASGVFAPVVQAKQGSSDGKVRALCMEALKSFAHEAGAQAAGYAFQELNR